MDVNNKVALVVEDDAPTMLFIRRILTKGGFQAIEAETGEAAIDLFRQHRPHLVVLDIMLPGMNGFQVCSALRSTGSDVGILMLTSKGAEEDKVQGLGLGADDYMVKPFSPAELMARTLAILRRVRRSELSGEAQEYRGIRLEFRPQKCFKDNKEICLTPHEFILLTELLRHPGKPQTRDQLYASVWGQDHHGSAKNLDVCIRHLREKIEDNPAEPTLIRTLRGTGYVLE